MSDPTVALTLFLRRPERLPKEIRAKAAAVINSDATDKAALAKAIKGQDLVYANLGDEDIEKQATAVVAAMDSAGVRRLIWISTLGIYDEVPGFFGKWNKSELGDYITHYAAAAKKIEAADLDYTVIRPAWLTDKDEIDYEITQKGETFKGTEVSRKSVADLVLRIIGNPETHIRESLGIDKPGTDGDRPAWYREA